MLIENRIYRNFIVTVHESGFAPSLGPVLGLYVIVDSNMDRNMNTLVRKHFSWCVLGNQSVKLSEKLIQELTY